MVTVTIAIKPYLARYMYVRYGQSIIPSLSNDKSFQPLPIHLSHTTPIYHLLHQLSVPHPRNASWRETGNICFVLPDPRNGKNPEVYNYIGQDSALMIEEEIEVEMRMELYEMLLHNKYKNGMMYKKTMTLFVERYQLEELIGEETLMRAFQRWRKQVKEDYKLDSTSL